MHDKKKFISHYFNMAQGYCVLRDDDNGDTARYKHYP